MKAYLVLSAAVVAFVSTTTAAQAADPATSCQSGKLKASGKYARCVLGADAKALLKGGSPDYSKCGEKITSSFSSAETKGAGACPGGTGDQPDIQDFLDASRQSVASALATGALPPPVDGVTRSFTDNGNGTITDNVTGLMWEKLSDDGTIHDKDNYYTWADAAAVKVAALNSTSFGGHNDWRVPTRWELETLLDLSTYNPATYSAFNTGCAPSCTVTTCSCTVSARYWSSTTYAFRPTGAWCVHFVDGGNVGNGDKTRIFYVRAVRGGL